MADSAANTTPPGEQAVPAAGETTPGGSVRPLRPMLARGAACDTCRARKVKCDASRPYCTPCLKSSRGDTAAAQSRCKYEGVTVAAAREAVAAARGGVSTGHAKGRKRKSEMMAAAAAVAAAGGELNDHGFALEEHDAAAAVKATKTARGRSSSSGAATPVRPARQNDDGPDPKRNRPNETTSNATLSDQDPSRPAVGPPLLPMLPNHPHSATADRLLPKLYPPRPDLQQPDLHPHSQTSSGSASGGVRWPLGAAVAHHLENDGDTASSTRNSQQPQYHYHQQQNQHGYSIPARQVGAGSIGPYNVSIPHQQQQQPSYHDYPAYAPSSSAQGGYAPRRDDESSRERDPAGAGGRGGGGGGGGGGVIGLEGRIADLERQFDARRAGDQPAAPPGGPPPSATTTTTDGAYGRSPPVPYTFPAAAAATAANENSNRGPSSSSASATSSSAAPPPASAYPIAGAYTSAAHSFAGAGSPTFAQLQEQQQQHQAGYGGKAPLTPGSYPPMQLVPPPPPSTSSAAFSPRGGVTAPENGDHGEERRGLSALSAAAAATTEQDQPTAYPSYPYSNLSYPSSYSNSYSGPSPGTAPHLGSLSRSASPATWGAAAAATTTTVPSPLHFSNLRQAASTMYTARRGSEPDAYALSSPRGAAVSAIRSEPSRPSSHQYQYLGGGGGGGGMTGTAGSTPSRGEVSASVTTQATTPPLLGGSNGSSPPLKSVGGNLATGGAVSAGESAATAAAAASRGGGTTGNGSAGGGGGGGGGSSSITLPEPLSAAEAAAESASYLLDEFSLTPELYQILHPQYPLSLPPLSTLHHLLTTFFLRATIPSTMLSRGQILQSLVFGPADPRWPEEALLHAMCAYAASFVSPDSLAGPNAHDDPMATSFLGGFDGGLSGVYARRSTYWEIQGDKNPREYHYRHAKRCILEAMGGVGLPPGHRVAKRRNLLQVLQATILTCYSAYQLANFMDVWMFAGHCTRLATPLGLNHLNAWDFDAGRTGPLAEDWGTRIRRVQRRELLEPAHDLEEHWERSVTFWMTFTIDRFASAITDLCTSIDEKDITTHLPCLATGMIPELAIDRVTGLIPALSISSPTFLEESAAPVGSLGAYIRSVVLFGRVITFLQRVPRNPCELQTETCSVIKASARAQPDFIELDIALSRFKATHSANFFDAAGNGIDMFSTCAYILPHVATILLHEGFTDRYDRSSTSSLNRSLASAKCIVNAMTILYHSSYDLGGIDPFIPWCWSVTGRSLVRDYATKRYWGAHDEALASRELAESVLGFHLLCAEKKIPIAHVLADTLKGYLDNPETLLPIDISDYRQL